MIRVSWLPANLASARSAELERIGGRRQGASSSIRARAAIGAGLMRIDGDAQAQARVDRPAARVVDLRQRRDRCADPPRSKPLVDVWGSHGDRGPLFASLKQAFDPHGILSPGRGGPYERLRSGDEAASRWATEAAPIGAARSTRRPSALVSADRHLRALRVLPAIVPDLRAVGRGDGLAARPHLPDEGGARRTHGDDAGVRQSLRRVPRLHGVRDGVPVRCTICAAHRSDARPDRSSSCALLRRSRIPRGDLRDLSVPLARLRVALSPLVVFGMSIRRPHQVTRSRLPPCPAPSSQLASARRLIAASSRASARC